MNILFTGTGAADYRTALSCSCDHCTAIRARGARNLRHHASLLVDGRILMDCGPTVPWRLAELGVPPAQVEALVLTHSHEDHLDLRAVESLLVARKEDRGPLPVWGNAACVQALRPLDGRLDLHESTVGETCDVSGLSFRPLPATHMTGQEQALTWLFGVQACRVWYATDSGWPSEEAWELLGREQLSAAIVEATFGLAEEQLPPGYLTEHMNVPRFLRLREELIIRGILPAEAPYVATHLSLHHCPIHDDLAPTLEPPVAVAWDGMEVRV